MTVILIVLFSSKIDPDLNRRVKLYLLLRKTKCFYLARASRLVQHFRGQLSGLTIEQNEELQRSSDCIRDCHQYIDIPDVHPEAGIVSITPISKQTKTLFLY
jgi:hypothetical protein